MNQLPEIPYRSAAGLGRTVKVLLVIHMALLVLSIFAGAFQNEILSGNPTQEEAEAAEILVGIVGLLYLVVFIALVVIFGMWIHRTYGNLTSLGVMKPRFSPGWAVGFYFIPVLNLFRPYQATKEVWYGSDPERNDFDPESYQSKAPSALLSWWWGMWLFSGMVARGTSRIYNRAETVDSLIAANKLMIFSDFMDILSALLAFLVVKRITDMQEQKHRQLEEERRMSADRTYGV